MSKLRTSHRPVLMAAGGTWDSDPSDCAYLARHPAHIPTRVRVGGPRPLRAANYLALALARAGRRGHPLPTHIDVYQDYGSVQFWSAVCRLAPLADPNRQLSRRMARVANSGVDLRPQKSIAARLRTERWELILEQEFQFRLTHLSPWQARVVLSRVLQCRGLGSRQQDLTVRTLARLIDQIEPTDRAVALEVAYLCIAQGGEASLESREHCDLPSSGFAADLARAARAQAIVRSRGRSFAGSGRVRRLVLHAERRWRRAGFKNRHGLCRCNRRITTMNHAGEAFHLIITQMLRPLVLSGAVETAHTVSMARLALLTGHISASAADLIYQVYSQLPLERARSTAPLAAGRLTLEAVTARRDRARSRSVSRIHSHLTRNEFEAAVAALPDPGVSGRAEIVLHSLGLYGGPISAADISRVALDSPGAVIALAAANNPVRSSAAVSSITCSRTARESRECARVLTGKRVELDVIEFLCAAAEGEPRWARTLVLSTCAARAALERSRRRLAARALLAGADPLHRLKAIAKAAGADLAFGVAQDYERAIRVLFDLAHDAPIPQRSRIARLAYADGAPRKNDTVLDALDVIVTASRARSPRGIDALLVRELGRLLRSDVLFHRRGRHLLRIQPQSRHTLRTPLIRSLFSCPRVRRLRPPRRPEYWRPEQRRPGGLLAFPVGEGVACLCRTRPYSRREQDLVRGIVRFLAARLEQNAALEIGPAEVAKQRRPHPRIRGIVGDAPKWRKVLDVVWKVAPSNVPVLILGETGTGKEVTARAIHLTSKRSQRPFVAVSCANLRGDTLLSTLFGHVRGAFSGAVRDHRGLFEQAHRGTLFLDELAEAPYDLQIALLRVLEDGIVRPVGSAHSRKVNVRIVTATNQDLDAARRAGRFRDDLFHRLSTVRLELPPLRERLEDLDTLANHLLDRHERGRRLHADALPLLAAYDWPGNIRELENVLRACLLLCDDAEVPPEAVRQALDSRRQARRRAAAQPSLAPRPARLLETLRVGWWSARELADRLGVSVRTVNRDLQPLVDEGLVEIHGEARRRRYRRPPAGIDQQGSPAADRHS